MKKSYNIKFTNHPFTDNNVHLLIQFNILQKYQCNKQKHKKKHKTSKAMTITCIINHNYWLIVVMYWNASTGHDIYTSPSSKVKV